MKSPFRSIRKTLFNEGKLVRYLGYAIGEIILIIVGILFALKINDWNEDKKAQVEFNLYVIQLKADVRTAIENVNDSNAVMETFWERAEFVETFLELSEFGDEELNRFEDGLDTLGSYNEPQVNVGLLGQLLNGNMDIIGRNRILAQKTLEMESYIEQRLNNLAHVYDQIDIASDRFNQFRGRGTRERGTGLRIKLPIYDLDHLKSSSEFDYTLRFINQRMRIILVFSAQIIESLEDFLTVLEEYE